MKNPLPDREFLNELITYDSHTGDCFWKVRPLHHFENEKLWYRWNKRYSGEKLSFIRNGQKLFSMGDKHVHNLDAIIIKMISGIEYSNLFIEHLDRNIGNNAWDNLKIHENVEYVKSQYSKNVLPDSKCLNECFDYDKDTGKLFWKYRPPSHFKNPLNWNQFNATWFGNEAGSEQSGTFKVQIFKYKYEASKIIYKMLFDIDLKHLIHLNGNNFDNRLDNLAPIDDSPIDFLKYKDGEELPSIEYLNECISYNPSSGECLWKFRNYNHFNDVTLFQNINSHCAGKIVGHYTKIRPYYICTLDKNVYQLDRLIIKIMTGIDSGIYIEHLNKNCTDNRWDNLKIHHSTNSVLNDPNYLKPSQTYLQDIIALPSYEYLHECFEYKENGELWWKIRPLNHFKDERTCKIFNRIYAHTKATFDIADYGEVKYNRVSINSIHYKSSRIIWKMHNGMDPKEFMDHMNNIRTDDRIENLREASVTENGRNRLMNKNSEVPHKGVHIDHRVGKYIASITIHNKTHYLGTYNNIIDAKQAYDNAAKDVFGEYFNDGYSSDVK